MRWPWQKTEKRENSLTDEIVARILARNAGTSEANSNATAAVEVAAGLISRAFKTALVSGPRNRVKNLTPSCLAMIARALIRSGEIVLALHVKDGEIHLWPAADHDVFGTYDPGSGPTGSTCRGRPE